MDYQKGASVQQDLDSGWHQKNETILTVQIGSLLLKMQNE